MDQATIKLRWDPIESSTSYDTDQIRYKLECFKCVTNHQSSNSSQSTVVKSSNALCGEKLPCESYIQIDMSSSVPVVSSTLSNQVTLKSLDSNEQYFIELYAHHIQNLFRTKTVDMLVKTSEAQCDVNDLVANLTAYQFVDMNQIILLWSNAQQTQKPLRIEQYEIRYWPLGYFNKANILTIQAPATNFTLRNANPSIISHNLYAFQLRVQTERKGWSAYTEPVEAVKIVNNNNFFYSLMKPAQSNDKVHTEI